MGNFHTPSTYVTGFWPTKSMQGIRVSVSNNNCKYNGKTLILEDMVVPRLVKGILVISVTGLFIYGKNFHLG